MQRQTSVLATALLLSLPGWAQQSFPADRATVNTRRPTIGVDFEQQQARNLRLYVDGREITLECQISGNRITWNPGADLAVGEHRAQAKGSGLLGLPVAWNWSFTIADNNVPQPGQNPGVMQLQPAQDATVNQSRPEIVVNYNQTLRNARVWIDGNDVTQQLRLSGNTFRLTPATDLSNGRHQVAVEAIGASGGTFQHNWSFEVRGSQSSNQEFSNLTPAPDSNVRRDNRPVIAGDYPSHLRNVRMTVDGEEVTSQTQIQGNRISWTPDEDLERGSHNVRLEGRAANGQISATEWRFEVRGRRDDSNPGGSDVSDFSVDEPVRGARVDKVFDVSGQVRPNSLVKVVVRPLPKRNKTVQFSGSPDRAGYYSIPVSASWATRGTRLEVQVTAVDRRTQRPVGKTQTFEVIRR